MMTTMTSKIKFKNTLDLSSFHDALDLIRVVKMLYGRDIAERLFTKIMNECYNVDSASLLKIQKV